MFNVGMAQQIRGWEKRGPSISKEGKREDGFFHSLFKYYELHLRRAEVDAGSLFSDEFCLYLN